LGQLDVKEVELCVPEIPSEKGVRILLSLKVSRFEARERVREPSGLRVISLKVEMTFGIINRRNEGGCCDGEEGRMQAVIARRDLATLGRHPLFSELTGYQ